jgi:hypothetical protein
MVAGPRNQPGLLTDVSNIRTSVAASILVAPELRILPDFA